MRSILVATLFLFLAAAPAAAGLAAGEEVAQTAPAIVQTVPGNPGLEVVPAGRPRDGSGGGMVNAVPEPSGFLAFAAGALLVSAAVRRRRALG